MSEGILDRKASRELLATACEDEQVYLAHVLRIYRAKAQRQRLQLQIHDASNDIDALESQKRELLARQANLADDTGA